MPLQKDTLTIPFRGGREKKLDPVIVDRAKLLELQNYTFATNGTLKRRDAWQSITNNNTLVGPIELATLSGELLAIQKKGGSDFSTCTMSALSQGSGIGLLSRGTIPAVSLRRDAMSQGALNTASSTNVQAPPSVASIGAITCTAWYASNSVYATLYDEGSNTFILQDALLYTGTSPRFVRVAAIGTTFVIVWGDGTHIYSTHNRNLGGFSAWPAATSIATDRFNATLSPLDFVPWTPTLGLLVYSCSTAGNSVNASTLNTSGAVVTGPIQAVATGTAAQGAPNHMAAAAFTTSAAGVVVSAGTVYTLTVSTASGLTVTNAAASTGATTTGILVGAVATSSSQLQVLIQSQTGTAWPLVTGTLNTSNTYAAGATLLYSQANIGPILASKPFLVSGTVYFFASVFSALQAGVYLMDVSGNVHAHAISGLGAPNQPTDTFGTCNATSFSNAGGVAYATVNHFGAQLFQGAFVSRLRLYFGRGDSFAYGQPAAGLTFVDGPLWHSPSSDSMYFSGGNLTMYDGVATGEAGFTYYPENVSVSASAGTGHLAATSSYLFAACYEWYDNRGRRHQSALSPLVTFTTDGTGTQGASVTVPTLNIGARVGSYAIVAFQSLANGTTLYRVGSTNGSPAPSGGPTQLGPFNQTDATLAGNEIVYTAGGYLSNTCPPSCRIIAQDPSSGRLCIAGLENPLEVRFSQAPVQGQGLYWNDALRFYLPAGYGEPRAMAFMDGGWYVWTESHRFVMRGSFPDATGANGTLTLPESQPADVGCTDQRSVALIPSGLGYQSQHGYYLLGREGADHYNDFGASIEPDVGQSGLTAVVLENKSQLRLCRPTGNFVLVYDYLYGQWSKFLDAGPTSHVSACVWNGLYTYADASFGQLGQDNVASIDLAGGINNVIVGIIKTAWLKVKDLAGFQRVWRVLFHATFGGNVSYDSALSLVVDTDYNFGGPNSYTVSIPSTSAIASTLAYDFRHKIQTQKCRAIAFTLTETPNISAPNYYGSNWSGLTLEYGLKKGGAKLPSGQST